jgi:hypothetical protein
MLSALSAVTWRGLELGSGSLEALRAEPCRIGKSRWCIHTTLRYRHTHETMRDECMFTMCLLRVHTPSRRKQSGAVRGRVGSPTLERDEPPLVIETICDHVRLCLQASGQNSQIGNLLSSLSEVGLVARHGTCHS